VTERLRCPPPQVLQRILEPLHTCTHGRKIRTDSIKQPPLPPTAANGTGAVHDAGTPRSSTSDVSTRTIHKQQQEFKK
jgi:hypothetical protein